MQNLSLRLGCLSNGDGHGKFPLVGRVDVAKSYGLVCCHMAQYATLGVPEVLVMSHYREMRSTKLCFPWSTAPITAGRRISARFQIAAHGVPMGSVRFHGCIVAKLEITAGHCRTSPALPYMGVPCLARRKATGGTQCNGQIMKRGGPEGRVELRLSKKKRAQVQRSDQPRVEPESERAELATMAQVPETEGMRVLGAPVHVYSDTMREFDAVVARARGAPSMRKRRCGNAWQVEHQVASATPRNLPTFRMSGSNPALVGGRATEAQGATYQDYAPHRPLFPLSPAGKEHWAAFAQRCTAWAQTQWKQSRSGTLRFVAPGGDAPDVRLARRRRSRSGECRRCADGAMPRSGVRSAAFMRVLCPPAPSPRTGWAADTAASVNDVGTMLNRPRQEARARHRGRSWHRMAPYCGTSNQSSLPARPAAPRRQFAGCPWTPHACAERRVAVAVCCTAPESQNSELVNRRGRGTNTTGCEPLQSRVVAGPIGH